MVGVGAAGCGIGGRAVAVAAPAAQPESPSHPPPGQVAARVAARPRVGSGVRSPGPGVPGRAVATTVPRVVGTGVVARTGVRVGTITLGTVSTLRGRSEVAVGRAGWGAERIPGRRAGCAGLRRSRSCGPLNGVCVGGGGVGGDGVGDACGVAVGLGVTCTAAATASGAGAAVGSLVGNSNAASAAVSISTRWTIIVLPSPSRYPVQATRKRMAAPTYCRRCQSVSESNQRMTRLANTG